MIPALAAGYYGYYGMSSLVFKPMGVPDHKDVFFSDMPDEAISMFSDTGPSRPASFGHIRSGVDGHIS